MSKYEDPRWQKLRLKVFERDSWRCAGCADTKSTLVAHHKKYVGNIWESPEEDLQTVCKQCHEDFGKHPKGGLWWHNDAGVRVLHIDHCPLCESNDFNKKGLVYECADCGWSSVFADDSVCNGTVRDIGGVPVLFGEEIRSVYLAGKMADEWRDELITNCENGWSFNNHGVHSFLDSEDDYSWSLIPSVVNVPGCPPIDLCGPYWNTSLDDWGGHGHAGLVNKHHPQMHSCGEAGDWGARYLTMARCRKAIERCDLFFAWIDSMDAFGTLVEIGMAVRSKCRIVIGFGRNTNQDLWFAATVADACVYSTHAIDAWRETWSRYQGESPAIRTTEALLAAASHAYRTPV